MKRIAPRNYPDYREGLLLDLSLVGTDPTTQLLEGSDFADPTVSVPISARVSPVLGGASVFWFPSPGNGSVGYPVRADLATPPFTVSVLVKFNSLASAIGGWMDFVTKKSTGAKDTQWDLTLSPVGDHVAFLVVDGSSAYDDTFSDSAATVGRWYFIEATITASGEKKLYIDEVVQSDVHSIVGMQGNGGEFHVGDSTNAAAHVDCDVAYVRMYDHILTTEQMKQVHDFFLRRFGILPIGSFQ